MTISIKIGGSKLMAWAKLFGSAIASAAKNKIVAGVVTIFAGLGLVASGVIQKKMEEENVRTVRASEESNQ